MSTDNIPRLQDPCNYTFSTPDEKMLTYTQTVNSPEDTNWYQFVYTDIDGLHSIEVDEDLNIRLEDGVLVDEPYSQIRFYLPVLPISLLIHANSTEDFFRGTAQIHVSESQELGLLNEDNYIQAKKLLGDRLIGGINLRVQRDEIGIVSVEACPVNEGQVPLF